MDDTYEQILVHLERAVNQLAGRVPEPKLMDFGNFYAFRYVERTIHQAIVQKLARMVSTLDAARLLLDHVSFRSKPPYRECWTRFKRT